MKKVTLLSAFVVGCLVGCGSPPPPESPAEDPGLAEPEVVEPEAPEPEPTEPEASEPEPAEPEEAPAPPEPPPEPAKPTCEELKKSRCKVTQGCAWREKGGQGECIPHGDY